MPVAGQSSGRKIDWKIQRLDIQVKKGDTLDVEYEVNYIDSAGLEQPYDFDGSTIKCQIRKDKTDDAWFRIITVSASENILSLYIDSKSLIIPAGNYQYDIEVEGSDGYHTTIIEGILVVTQDVTQWTDSLEYHFTNVLKTVYNMVILPFYKPITVFQTGFSVLMSKFLEHINISVFRTLFTVQVLPGVIIINLLRTNWTMLMVTTETYNNMLTTSWSANIAFDEQT